KRRLQVIMTLFCLLKTSTIDVQSYLFSLSKKCLILRFNRFVMEIRGKVHEIGTTQQVTDTFKKRDLIVSYAENPQFVEYIRFEATQDRVSIFDNLSVGDDV